MPTIVWALIWVAVVAVVAFFFVRELRQKRKPIKDFDRMQHQAVRESDQRAGTHGPDNTSQIGFGG